MLPMTSPGIGQAIFEKQPPSDLRKSNFFNFCTSFLDTNGHVITIIHASFHEFIENDREPESHTTRNGVLYKVVLLFANGTTKKENLYVRLIDATTKEVVPYEGQDKNPEMRRVLITHEALCNRCGNNKSCGNKNETPSDPVITEQRYMKFFLKCNQNCLKVAGNPKDNRRFQIVLSGDARIHANSRNVYGVSEDMFVHNNSKHLRKKRKTETEYDLHLNGPRIDVVHPKSGTWGTEIVLIGDNFQEGFEVCLANTPIKTKMLTPTALSATVPALHATCTVPISVCYKNKPVCFAETTSFQYIAKDLDFQIQRLANILPPYQKHRSKVTPVASAKDDGTNKEIGESENQTVESEKNVDKSIDEDSSVVLTFQTTNTKKRRVSKLSKVEGAIGKLQKITQSRSSTSNIVQPDEVDVFGKYVAAQLRDLPIRNRLTCLHKIQSMLTKERLKLLESPRPSPSILSGDSSYVGDSDDNNSIQNGFITEGDLFYRNSH